MNIKITIFLLLCHIDLFAQEQVKILSKHADTTAHGFTKNMSYDLYKIPAELRWKVLKTIYHYNEKREFLDYNESWMVPELETYKPYCSFFKNKYREYDTIYAYNPSKQLLALAKPNVKIKLYDLLQPNKRPTRINVSSSNDFVFDATGKELLYVHRYKVAADNFASIRGYNLETKKERLVANCPSDVSKIAISHANKWLAIELHRQIQVRDLATDTIFRTYGINIPLKYLKFSHDGNRLVSINYSCAGRIYDINSERVDGFTNVSPQNRLVRQIVSQAHDLIVPDNFVGASGQLKITVNPDYLKKSFENLKEYQRSLIYFLFGAEYALQERYHARREKEGRTYYKKHKNPMPIDFDLFKKYNPQFKTWDFHGTLSKFDPILKWHLVKRFNIVRK